jgi:molecular chaperone DnaK
VHAGEDKKRRETIEARNQLDSLIYQTEKSLGDQGGAIDAAARAEIETAVGKAKQVLENTSADADQLREAANELSKASHKLAEAMYAKVASERAGDAGASGGGAADGGAAGGEGGGRPKDDVVDADFEEVKGG